MSGLIVSLLIFGAGILYWFFRRRGQLQAEYESGLLSLFTLNGLLHIVPATTWWLILTWLAYSAAGEKMPWLSSHFVIPMGILVGWYFNDKLLRHSLAEWTSRNAFIFLGLSTALIVVIFAALSPILQGSIRLGSQELAALSGYGRFIGAIIIVGLVVWLWLQVRAKLPDKDLRNTLITMSFFILLSLLTIRFSYMASFPNKDSAREFMVYAHGAPAAKDVVLDQIETMSQRLNGDNGLSVAFGGSGVSWAIYMVHARISQSSILWRKPTRHVNRFSHGYCRAQQLGSGRQHFRFQLRLQCVHLSLVANGRLPTLLLECLIR